MDVTRRKAFKHVVLNEIEDAFRGARYPGDDDLVYDPTYPDVGEVRDAFRGRDWRDLDVHLLRFHIEALSFFTSKAFGYYLPAFLRASLLHPKQADVIPLFVCIHLNPHKNDGPELSRFKERMAIFNSDQTRAIVSFLNYAAECLQISEAKHGLHRFWRYRTRRS